MLAYYPLCFVYALLAFPLLAYLGGGREGVRRLRRHPAPRGDRARHLLVRRHHSGEYGGRGGTAASRTRSRILFCRWARRCTWTARASAACSRSRSSSACSACRLRARDCLPRCWPWRSFLRRHERHPRRRLHRRVHPLLALLPRPDGGCHPIAVTIGIWSTRPPRWSTPRATTPLPLVARITEGKAAGWSAHGRRARCIESICRKADAFVICCPSLFEVGEIHHDGVVAHDGLLVEQHRPHQALPKHVVAV